MPPENDQHPVQPQAVYSPQPQDIPQQLSSSIQTTDISQEGLKTRHIASTIGFVFAMITLAVDIFTILVGGIAALNVFFGILTTTFGIVALTKNKTRKNIATIIIGVSSILLGLVWWLFVH